MKNLYYAIGILGLIILLGTAGSSDLNTISFTQIIVQILISAALLFLSSVGLRYEQNFKRRRRLCKTFGSAFGALFEHKKKSNTAIKVKELC